jgi:hypothetical protein
MPGAGLIEGLWKDGEVIGGLSPKEETSPSFEI